MNDTDTMIRVVNGRASKEEAESYIAGLITRLAEAEKWRDHWQAAAADAEATQAKAESQLLSLTEENERLRLLLDSWDDLESDWPGSFDAALTSWLFRLRELADVTRTLSPIDPPLSPKETS